MASYAIGDVQGCYESLLKLIKKINFDPEKDKLYFCGDLVNRGGKSLEVLRWVYAHRESCKVVLGNHDLALLAQYYVPELRDERHKEFSKIFKSTDCEELLDWLTHQKLLIHKKKFKKVIVHAGIYPKWNLKTAKREATYVESILKNSPLHFFKNMYGSKPNHWKKSLQGMDRARFIVNSFTRMRYLFKNSGLNFRAKGGIKTHEKLVPWFLFRQRVKIKSQIVFGHWSALGLHIDKDFICLDSGKVWGGKLTALKLAKSVKKSKHIFQV